MHYTEKNSVPIPQQSITKECHLFSIKAVLLQFSFHDNDENLVIVFPICLIDCVKSFITLLSEITEVWQIDSFFIIK